MTFWIHQHVQLSMGFADPLDDRLHGRAIGDIQVAKIF